MGQKRIQQTMVYAHPAPQHKIAAIERFADLNRKERVPETPAAAEPAVILTAPAGRTGSTTDTEEKQAVQKGTRNVP
jgi:hypothetical protein